MKGMGNILKQAQEMQKRMASMQEEVASLRADGISGGGMIKAEVNGKLNLLQLTIDPSVIDPSDPEMLEDLVLVAVQEAQKKASALVQEKMAELTGGMNLPNIPGLFG